jgi:hypothetical protein
MLANDIFENYGLISKEFYSNLYAQHRPEIEREDWKKLGERDFAKYFGGNFGDSLDPQIINKDLNKLNEILGSSSKFIDRRLAHLDKREPTKMPMYFEIESGCQTLNVILKKCILLLRAIDYKIEPVLQHDWKIIFRAAWL